MTEFTCKSCIHSRCSKLATFFSYLMEWKGPESHWYKCAKSFSPAHEISHPVVGTQKVKAKMDYCEVYRNHGKCGPDAKYWAPKKKKDLFKMLTKEYND